MYCPKCNLHSEEYVDKCPLCDGPMEVDEVASGVMKTPPIPEDGGTEELPLQEAMKLEEEEPVTLEEDLIPDEAADMDALEGVEDLDASQSGEMDGDLGEPDLDEPELAEPTTEPELEEPAREAETEESAGEFDFPPEIPSEPEQPERSNKSVLFGVLILILLIAGGGYYYFVYAPQAARPLKKQSKKVVTIAKKAPPAEISVKDEEQALMTEAPEPADVAMETDTQPAEGGDEPFETKTDPFSAPSEATATVEESPASVEQLPVAATERATEVAPGGTSSEPSLSEQTPAEMALADAKKALEEEPLPPASADGPYLVSASSFKEEVLAAALADKLVQAGYPASTVMVELPEKGTWYRVVVGGYANRDDAGVVSARIKESEGLDTWIMKR